MVSKGPKLRKVKNKTKIDSKLGGKEVVMEYRAQETAEAPSMPR